MFRRIILCFFSAALVFQVFGNSRIDELRRSMHEAPDSARAAILVSIAQAFQRDNVDSCLYYAQRAVEAGFNARQYHAVIDAEKIRFQIAVERMNYIEATRHQRTILEISVRERYWDLAMESYNAMAQTWMLRNNSAEAIEFLKQGLQIAVDRNNLELQKYFYQALIDSYRRLRNTEEVSHYFPLLMDVNRTIDAQAFNSRIHALQTERETLIEAAEEAKTRWQQRTAISRVFHVFAVTWAILATMVLVMAYIWHESKMKPDLLKAKNDLSMKTNELDLLVKNQENAFRFLSFHVNDKIDLLSQNVALFETESGHLPVVVDSPLNRALDSVLSLYGFFQNFTLLLQANSGYMKPKSATVNIPQMVNSLLGEYEKTARAKNIRLVNDVQNNTFAYADERLIETVLRNVISNALKFAPDEKGTVTVGAKVGTRVEVMEGFDEDTGFVEAWVIDDGIGLTPEQVKILFDLSDNLLLPGEPEKKGYGLGLAVSKAVVEALGGRIWVETKPDEGFCLRFCLPRARDTEVKTLSLSENTQEYVSMEESSETQLLLPE